MLKEPRNLAEPIVPELMGCSFSDRESCSYQLLTRGKKADASVSLAMKSVMSALDRTLFSGICSLLYIRQVEGKYNLISTYMDSGKSRYYFSLIGYK